MSSTMSNQKPIVSVIVPCYNQDKYLAEALDSVLAQTFADWEIVIVDDGSTDKSADIAKEYAKKDARIHYIYQQNAGPSAARNHGVRASRGKYLQFLDGDNKLTERCIEYGVEHMESHPDTVLFYSHVHYFGMRQGDYHIRWTGYADLLCQNSIDCCCMVRRTDFDRIGGFDEQMRGYEDWEFFIRLLYDRPNVYQHPDVLFYYRITDSQTGVNAQALTRKRELCNYMYEKNKEKFVAVLGDPVMAYKEAHRLEKELNGILASKKYRLGEAILAPLKWLTGLFGKK